ncbi:hypothetical protein Bca52824_094079 [Brassica carinata]|uniref:40S ribosomal protein S29 n=1 Tax=Brassica carinata TaxID=52824 RepID=A0A8X7P3X3_BRACI|nr:hypothetical protein Bca52824_094079 [Brassica carinata]
MGFAAIWNSHPKKYGPGSRTCRVCGNSHGLIRKYGLNCCRQCFRSNAKEIGFIKKNKKLLRFQKNNSHVWNCPKSLARMGSDQNPSRSDTSEIKSLIYRQIGTQRADSYFHHLGRFFASRITKPEFDKLCLKTIGRQHISLHNRLIRSIIKNASVAKSPPSRYVKKGGSFVRISSDGKQRDGIRGRKFRDRPSPLGPLGKPQSVTTITTSATELMSLGSRPPLEVEEGEEVEQVAAGSSSVPVTAPFGVAVNLRRKAVSCASLDRESCQSSGELPDTRTLRSRLERRLEMEGVKVSMDAVSLLNSGLDAFMRRLIEPCLSLASARCGGNEQQRRWLSSFLSMSDFRAAMELNPQVLGEEWPVLLEKISSRGLDE